MTDEIEIRPLDSLEDYRACVALQRETWGAGFSDIVPLSILKTSQRMGGVTAGAFDSSGSLAGFVFGMTGLHDGQLAHWSDLLAVRPEWRGKGLGKRLKLYQREVLLKRGVETVYWTYDPLQARNAHLNLNGLGCTIAEYVENMYGEDTASDLHAGLGTDRFVVEWDLSSPRVHAAIAGGQAADPQLFDHAPVVNTAGNPPAPQETAGPWPDAEEVLVEIPPSILDTKTRDPEAGRKWRVSTRRAFLHYLHAGYRVEGFISTPPPASRCAYVLAP